MRDDGLRNYEIKFSAEDPAVEILVVVKLRSLQMDNAAPKFTRNALFDQPTIRIYAEVSTGPQKGNCQPPQSKRPATDIKNAMPVAQPELEEKRELGGAHCIVSFRRPDISPVMIRPGRKTGGFIDSPVPDLFVVRVCSAFEDNGALTPRVPYVADHRKL